METMTFEDLRKLTCQMETEQVEFKETTGQLDRGMETLCAFLNGEGGTVLFGVTDKGKITGQEVGDQTKRSVTEATQRIEPLPAIRVFYIPVGDSGKTVIAIHAEEQRYDRPFTYKNRAYRRLESVTSAMPQVTYNSLLMQRGGTGYSWESLINEELKWKDLDEDEECCTNALCHRTYNRPGSSVGIAIYDDRIEIENSGTLPLDMTIEKLKSEHRSEPQNPLIADVLYKRKVVESWGRGIGLMIDECRRVGLPEPEFHTNGNFVWVVFRYGDQATDQVTMQVTMQDTMQDTMQVTMQVQKLVSSMNEQPLSVKEMMKLLSLNNRDYFRREYLHPALKGGYIVPLYPGQPRSPKQKYRLTEKGRTLLK